MVRLGRLASHLPAPVLGKCEFLNPGGSIKDRIALAILDAAQAADGTELEVELADGTAPATVAPLAIYDPEKKRPRM